MKRVLTIGTTTLVVALLGLFVIGSVFAQDPTPKSQTPWEHIGGGISKGFAMVHDTINELLGLTPEEIHADCLRVLRECRADPHFILGSTGADIAIDTPVENLLAWRHAVEIAAN